jgi:2-polyprenyl-3-methyl-5-hydroxy-6-metoxy-1,4-benzoquinol methylase
MSADLKIERACIVCNGEQYDDKFTYTYEFMSQVRGHDEASLRQQGWAPGTTSTIVKCRQCGCNYVRDVLSLPVAFLAAKSAARARPEALNEHVVKVREEATYKRYQPLDQLNWMVRNLILLAAGQQNRDIRVLDFGAGGGGQACNAARACGARDVVAYDPYFHDAIQDYYDAANFPGIQCISTATELAAHAPYDAVIFQSAVEHVMDPRAELQLIFDNMATGGFLYVNNPVMDLDKELAQLMSAKKIQKRDVINHYHPWHLNYMMPREFEKMLKDIGFEILPLVHYPPPSPVAGAARRNTATKFKAGIRWLQNALGLPYKRYVYFVQKP